jgi:hypothetical protein
MRIAAQKPRSLPQAENGRSFAGSQGCGRLVFLLMFM